MAARDADHDPAPAGAGAEPQSGGDAAGATVELLARIRDGDEAALAHLIERTHRELRRVARCIMSDQDSGHTLQPTALVNEAVIRLTRAMPGDLTELGQWIRLAARAMRTALIDHERAKKSDKRGGGRAQVSLHSGVLSERPAADSRSLLDVEALLVRLEALDPELAQVVELKVFGGQEMPEVAALLGLSLRTAERRWKAARLWLLDQVESRSE